MKNPVVDTARFFTEFCVEESCGKCTPCRAGLARVEEIFDSITIGTGKIEDISTLEKTGFFIRDASLCGLGQTAPNPVLTTLRYFKDEYLQHIVEKKCEAGKCFQKQKEA
jgi:NADP-reducing hydrogenase subunit HndC